MKEKTGYIENIRKQITALFRSDDVFWNNEIRANVFVCIQLYILTGVLLLSYVLAGVGVFDVPMYKMGLTLLINVPLMLVAALLCNIYKGQKHWIKYMLCLVSVFISVSLCATLNIFVTLVTAIPVVLSVRYYSKRLTVVIAIASAIGMLVSEIIFGLYGMVNLNLVSVPKGTVLEIGEGGLRAAVEGHWYDVGKYMSSLFRGSFLPRMLLFFIIAFTCIELAEMARRMVLEQDMVTKKNETMKAELNMAAAIQKGVLPKLASVNKSNDFFELNASMDPAKEVGGDFYDFFFLDDDHLVLVMADVSGKGIPAALFMMVSKILIKSYASTGDSPSKLAGFVNEQLCADNPAEMFVTAWIGIVELSTGIVTCTDLGHEYPAIYRKETGKFEILKDHKGFVLGGMESVNYKETTFTMNKGDVLFLYTDGVPEATNADNKLFGIRRMIDALNETPGRSSDDIMNNLKRKIDSFVQDAPQFDDMTMLVFKYKGK